MEYIQKNARTIILFVIVIGLITAISFNGSDNSSTTTEETKVADTQQTDQDNTGSDEQKDNTNTDTKAVVKIDDEFTTSAVSGDNQTVMIRRVVTNYLLESNDEISPEQSLFIETKLVDTLPRNDLIFVGDTVKVSGSQLKSTVEASQKLTPAQTALWAQYL